LANYLDLDSDDDTCPDALEGDGGFVSTQLEIILKVEIKFGFHSTMGITLKVLD